MIIFRSFLKSWAKPRGARDCGTQLPLLAQWCAVESDRCPETRGNRSGRFVSHVNCLICLDFFSSNSAEIMGFFGWFMMWHSHQHPCPGFGTVGRVGSQKTAKPHLLPGDIGGAIWVARYDVFSSESSKSSTQIYSHRKSKDLAKSQ